ncbi:MAG: GntR family transcriptional regulator [Lautropia sp.]|nr:GntR family transcriptional regulator [Lautropia sp.]
MQLEADGLVEIIPRRGATVTRLSLAEVDDVFALRMLLEPRLYEASSPKLDIAAIEAASLVNEQYRQAIQNQEYDQLGALNAHLHMSLYTNAGMPKTQQIVASLLQTSERYTRIQLNSEAALYQSLTEHDEWLQLTRSGQFSKGRTLLISHLNYVWQGLRQVLTKS